jgi:CHAT domain-containing protein
MFSVSQNEATAKIDKLSNVLLSLVDGTHTLERYSSASCFVSREMADVFISYSRKDKPFVQVLHQALAESKYDAWVDWEDIPITADWWEEIKAGIEAADTFVFVISPDSVTSRVCGKEVDHAMAHNKRLVPIVRREVPDKLTLKEALKRHNWLYFRDQDGFEQSFQKLVKALDIDLEHTREHTRILIRTLEWDQKQRSESLLLRGDDLLEAEQWLAKSIGQAPLPTDLQQTFIKTSRSVEDANQQATQILQKAATKAKRFAAISALAGLLITAGTGWFAFNASQRAIEADRKATLAEAREQEANQKIDEANKTIESLSRRSEEVRKQAEAAQNQLEVAQARQQEAEAKSQRAEEDLLAAEQQVQASLQKAQSAEVLAQEAAIAQQDAQKQAEAARADLAQANAEVAARKQEALRLEAKVQQAGGQLETIQQDLAVTIADALERVERQTQQNVAVVYITFTKAPVSDNDLDTGEIALRDALSLWLITDQGSQQEIIPVAKDVVLDTTMRFQQGVMNAWRPNGYTEPGRQLYNWFIGPIMPALEASDINNLVFLMAPELRQVPLAALHNGENFLIEDYSLGIMPGLTLTDTYHVDLGNAQVLLGGLTEGTEDLPPLPGVISEIAAIRSLWEGEALFDEDFTLENLDRHRQQKSFPIVHLATHGNFKVSEPDEAFIQLGDQRLFLAQLEALDWYTPAIELLVLSGCRGAIGNEEYHFGLASAALQAGVKSVLASSAYVGDAETAMLMSEFYTYLRSAPTKAEALRQAQLAMLTGQVDAEGFDLQPDSSPGDYVRGITVKSVDMNLAPVEVPNTSISKLAHPYYWATFRIVGNPW